LKEINSDKFLTNISQSPKAGVKESRLKLINVNITDIVVGRIWYIEMSKRSSCTQLT
jgi:hypothetical protein